jgi:hypothetical protein
MNSINKTVIRAAVLIREQVAGSRHHDPPLQLPEYSWNEIQQLRRQIGLARQHGWHAAAAQLTRDLADAINDLCFRLETAGRNLQSRPTERRPFSASEIYRDILALDEEFEGLEIDFDKHELSVTTDRIVLEDWNLGAFQIRLDWHSLGEPPAYRVVALDPHPPASRDDVTHPHVQDEHLCEGDGRAAIRAALTECRLYDFFMLVSQVLHTYGRGSAYVELDKWNGICCDDCGNSIHEDDRYYCSRCDATLCSGCSCSCEDCGESYCSGCLGTCAACGCDYCSSCLAMCPVCKKRFCEDCRQGGLCKSCHQKQQEDQDDDPSEDTRSEAVTVPA